MLDMAKAVDGGAGMTGTDMAPRAAAWCKESRAWRTVSRVWIIADSRWRPISVFARIHNVHSTNLLLSLFGPKDTQQQLSIAFTTFSE